jgi:addiction module RelE/StbE family toxin
MAYRLEWSPEAIEDIESIADYIERDSKFYAKSVVNKIFQSTEKLKEFPKIGRVVPELGREDIRELIVCSYRLVYQVKEIQILIIAVIHSKRQFEDVIEEYRIS